MALISRRLLRSTSVFLSSQRGLHHPELGDAASDHLSSLAHKAGVSRIAFLRHGNTAPKKVVDFDRVLTDLGRQQVQTSARSFGQQLLPLFPTVLVSPAPRTMETAQIFVRDELNQQHVSLQGIQALYDDTMQPEGSRLFQKIGYAPLRDYWEDPSDGAVAREILGAYGVTFLETVCDRLSQLEEGSSSGGPTSALLFVGHAIYLPSAALVVAQAAGCDNLDVVWSTNTQEAEGYLVDLEHQTVSTLCR